jgi:hypothetical protein
MTKVNRHRTYGKTPEWRIIAKALIEPRTGRPLLNRDLRQPVKLTKNGLLADVERRFRVDRQPSGSWPKTCCRLPTSVVNDKGRYRQWSPRGSLAVPARFAPPTSSNENIALVSAARSDGCPAWIVEANVLYHSLTWGWQARDALLVTFGVIWRSSVNIIWRTLQVWTDSAAHGRGPETRA